MKYKDGIEGSPLLNRLHDFRNRKLQRNVYAITANDANLLLKFVDEAIAARNGKVNQSIIEPTCTIRDIVEKIPAIGMSYSYEESVKNGRVTSVTVTLLDVETEIENK